MRRLSNGQLVCPPRVTNVRLMLLIITPGDILENSVAGGALNQPKKAPLTPYIPPCSQYYHIADHFLAIYLATVYYTVVVVSRQMCTNSNYLSISRGIPATKRACDDDHHLLVLEVCSVVVLHAVKVRGKDTTKHIVDNVGIVTGPPRFCGVEDCGLDSTLVVLAEDASCVTHQPR